MSKNDDQFKMFEVEESWREDWKDMPEFEHDDLTSNEQIIVHFANQKDRDDFSKLIGQKITYKTQSIWFPKADIDKYMDKRYTTNDE